MRTLLATYEVGSAKIKVEFCKRGIATVSVDGKQRLTVNFSKVAISSLISAIVPADATIADRADLEHAIYTMVFGYR